MLEMGGYKYPTRREGQPVKALLKLDPVVKDFTPELLPSLDAVQQSTRF